MAVYKCKVVRRVEKDIEIRIDDDDITNPDSIEAVKEYINCDIDLCNEIDSELDNEEERWDFKITECKRIK